MIERILFQSWNLYDQALFSIACIESYQVTRDSFFRKACEETLAYVERELSSPKGGFFSAEDADSEGIEGKFYLWTNDELVSILGEKDAMLFVKVFRCEQEGNYLDEATGQKTGANIPHLTQEFKDYARDNTHDFKEFHAGADLAKASHLHARAQLLLLVGIKMKET